MLLALARRLLGGHSAAVGFSCAMGYAVGHVGLLGVPAGIPAEPTQWLLPLALGAVLPAIWERLLGKKFAVVILLRLAVSALVSWLLLRPLLAYTFTRGKGIAWVLGSAAVLTLVWSSLAFVESRLPASAFAGFLAFLAMASSGVIMLSRSASVAMLAGVLTSVLGVLAVLSFPGGRGVVPGVVPVTALLYVSHAAIGYHYAEMRAAALGLLLAAPAAAAVLLIRGGRRSGAGLAIAGACALAAFLLSYAASG